MENTDKLTDKKNIKQFNCLTCNFTCIKKGDYNRHLTTRKHKNMTNTDNYKKNIIQKYSCECGKTYKHRQSLHNHKKTCSYINNTNNESEIDYEELYFKALKNNKEKICFKNLYLKLNIDLNTYL
tara:strand:- start:107 stop:481 length:375 start_codon:yes stop_codon:yes gene_type:complete